MASQSSVCGKYSVVFEDTTYSTYTGTDGDSMECGITVKENKSGRCYVVDYKWSIAKGHRLPASNNAFPFAADQNKDGDETDSSGVIVAKNDMTTQMIRHLVMPDTELQAVCGVGTSTDYRAKIIRALATMWD